MPESSLAATPTAPSRAASATTSRRRPRRRSPMPSLKWAVRDEPVRHAPPAVGSEGHIPPLDGATGWPNSERARPCRAARPRRARELLDAGVHQLAAPGALRPRVLADLPERRIDRDRSPYAGVH